MRKADVPAVAVLLGLLAWQAVWATLIPAAHTTDVALAWTEFRPILVLLAPSLALIACASTTQLARVVATMRVLVRSATVLAVVQIVIWVIGSIYRQFQAATALLLARAFPGTADFLYVGPMPDGFFRVFWVNSIWLPVAFFLVPLVVRRVSMAAGSVRFCSRGCSSHTRAVSGSAHWSGEWSHSRPRSTGAMWCDNSGASRPAWPPLASSEPSRSRRRVKLIGPFSDLRPRLRRPARQPDERVLQIAPLVRVWETAPLVGVGYGGYARDYVRAETAPFSYENTPYAMLAKLGLIGLSGTLAALGYCGVYAWRVRRDFPNHAPQFLGAYVSFLLATMTNPMLLNFVGMTVLSCLLLQWAQLRSDSVDVGPRRLAESEKVGS